MADETEEFEFRLRLEKEAALQRGGILGAAAAAQQYNPAVGIGEAGLKLATGTAGAIAGGFSGLGTAATNALGLTDTPPGDRVAQVSNALTYEPRTKAGRAISGVVEAPFELLGKGADWAGGKTTDAGMAIGLSPERAAGYGTAVNTAINALPMLAGPLARGQPGESAATAAARSKTRAMNAPTDAGIAAAREAGLAITPTQAEAGVVARGVESLSGSARLEKAASKKNAPVMNDLIRKDLGLAEDIPGSREAHAKIRADAGADYEFVKNAGRVTTDGKYQSDLQRIVKSYDTAAKDFSHRSENPFQKTLDGLKANSFDAASAVEEVKLLRKDADKAYRTGDSGLGKAYKDAALALDDMLDRHLKKLSVSSDLSGDPAMANGVARYQQARTRIAKSYAADKALNDATGNYDAGVYAAELKRGKPLTGGARTVADFATQFPKSAQRAEKIGPTGATAFDLLLPLVGKEALLLGARPAARSGLLSGIAQRQLTAPRTYGQSGARSLQDLLAEIKASQAALVIPAGRQGIDDEIKTNGLSRHSNS